jgi:hypothetical protein
MAGHYHANDSGLTQNQGNSLGDRPCVRQSRLYREHVGGNTMKDILGNGGLQWDTQRLQGAYEGGRSHGDGSTGYGSNQQPPQQHQQQQQQQQASVPQWQQPPPAQQPPQQQQQRSSGAHANQQQYSIGQQQQPQQQAPQSHRPGAGQANRTTYNFMTGQ